MKSGGHFSTLASVVVGAASVRWLQVFLPLSVSLSLSLSHGAQPSRSGGQIEIVNAELAAGRCT